MRHRRLGRLAAALLAAFAPTAPVQADENAGAVQTPTVEVIGTTPLPGLGLPIDQLPSNVQVVTESEIDARQAVNVTDFMSRTLPSANVNDVTGNPYTNDYYISASYFEEDGWRDVCTAGCLGRGALQHRSHAAPLTPPGGSAATLRAPGRSRERLPRTWEKLPARPGISVSPRLKAAARFDAGRGSAATSAARPSPLCAVLCPRRLAKTTT